MKNREFFTVKSKGQDISLQVKDFNTPSIETALEVGEYIYVGYYKPFRQTYVEFDVLNTEDVNVVFEYFNGTAWTELKLIDETFSFSKSGFLYWNRPEDWALETIDSDELFYVRMSVSAPLSLTTSIKGINVLLSNDIDLTGIRSNIVSKHNSGNSWIEKHEAARKHIIQELRNLGNRVVKINEYTPFYIDSKKDSKTYLNLTQFDLLEPFELREAAKFYALSYIYLDELSDENDDKWERAGLRHERRADEAMSVFMLKVDTDDDGVEDSEENDGEVRATLSWE